MSENGPNKFPELHENIIAEEAIETLAQVAEALNLTPDYVRKKIAFAPQWKAPLYKRVHQHTTKSTNADYFFSAGTIELNKEKFKKAAQKSHAESIRIQEENEKLKKENEKLKGQFAIMKKTILDGGYWPPATVEV